MKPCLDADTKRAARAIGRREFLLRAAAGTGLASRYLRGQASAPPAHTATRSAVDTASSTAGVRSLVTPNADFFLRNHFRTPTIREEKWNLEIGGMVAKPFTVSYSDLLLTPSVRRPLTLECAGNLSGGPGVSTAVWSGVPLESLLKQAGVQAGATTVIFYGADSGEGEGLEPGTHFARAIPLEKAMDQLTPMERTAFVLRHMEEKSIGEIASALGATPSSVKQAVFRAVAKLRRALKATPQTIQPQVEEAK